MGQLVLIFFKYLNIFQNIKFFTFCGDVCNTTWYEADVRGDIFLSELFRIAEC